MSKKICLLVDWQNTFVHPKGGLYVKDAEKLTAKINEYIKFAMFDEVWACVDWHPARHVSFASTHGKELFSAITLDDGSTQVMWPDHGMQGTWDGDFAEGLETNKIKFIVRKGTDVNVDSYSAFFDNGGKPTGLGNLIQDGDSLVCIGVAGDYCVKATAIDGRKFCKNVIFNDDLCAWVDENNKENVFEELKEANVGIQVSRRQGE